MKSKQINFVGDAASINSFDRDTPFDIETCLNQEKSQNAVDEIDFQAKKMQKLCGREEPDLQSEDSNITRDEGSSNSLSDDEIFENNDFQARPGAFSMRGIGPEHEVQTTNESETALPVAVPVASVVIFDGTTVISARSSNHMNMIFLVSFFIIITTILNFAIFFRKISPL